MASRLRVLAMMGGRSGEHEVSLNSARSILAVLDPAKYDVVPVGITHAGEWVTGEDLPGALEKGQTATMTRVTLLPYPGSRTLYAVRQGTLEALCDVDVVFTILHGSFGEDGTLQGLLEMANLPYVGSGVLGSSVGMDKALFKDIMRQVDVPVLPSIVVSSASLEHDLPGIITQAEKISAYPLFTKPANLGSSVGVTKCRNRSDLMEGLMDAARYDRRVLVERGLEKPREIEVGVLGNEQPLASLPGEVVPGDEFYSYRAKYLDDSSELIIPAPLSEELVQRLQQLAVRAFQAIDCAGMARIDFLIDRNNGEIYVSEINTIPG
ncbi:D-alanine--D-alanine ligase, partial [bacterium]|nr:D-alanine--D-alanine ligase [bacterium]